MCGRFTLVASGDALAELFDIAEIPDTAPRYNVAPTQPILAVRAAAGREFVHLRRGLLPSLAKEVGGAPLINARSETVADKPAFRSAFRKRRCIIPVSGFFEWQKPEGKKQPYYIGMRDRRPFAFAGLWERWEGPSGPATS